VVEGILEQTRDVLPQKDGICHVWLGHDRRVPKRSLYLAGLDQMDQFLQQQSLQFETCTAGKGLMSDFAVIPCHTARLTALVVGIGQNIEDVTQHCQQILLEEGVGDGWILLSEVANQLDGH